MERESVVKRIGKEMEDDDWNRLGTETLRAKNETDERWTLDWKKARCNEQILRLEGSARMTVCLECAADAMAVGGKATGLVEKAEANENGS